MAEEQKPSSKKRTARANDLHPMAEMFTRSKSQIYLHRNRSGRVRFDPFPQPLSEKRRRRVPNEDSPNNDVDDEFSRLLIKDLRTRRVFSDGFGLTTPTENETEKGIGGIRSKFSINTCFEPKIYEDGDVSNGYGGSVEEFAQSTPPDIDLLINAKLVEEKGNPNMGFVTEKQSNEMDKKNSRVKSFLSPCSRGKLFKAPGSFSYRRLLPYLMDCSEENSLFVGGKKLGLEGKTLPTSHGQEILINKSTMEKGPTKCNDLDSGNQLMNSTSIECIKEPPMGRQFSNASISMVEEWSKPIVNGGVEKFCIKNNSVSVSSGDTKLVDTRETENADVGNPENMNNLNCTVSLVLEKKCKFGKDNEDGQCFEATQASESEGVYKSDVGGSSEISTLNHANSNLPDGELNENFSNADQIDDGAGELLDDIDNSNKEYALTTPPDDHFFGKPKVAENGGTSLKCMHTADNIPGKSLIGISYGNNSVNDKTIGSSPRRKMVMSLRSRMKLFRTPGSVSYRRMLPFLINMEEDNSCASGKGHVLKLEKMLDANPPSPSLVSDYQEMLLGNAKGNDCRADCSTGYNNAMPISATAASSNDQKMYSELFKHFNESLNPLSDLHFERDKLDTGRKLDSGPEIVNINHESNPPDTPLCAHSSSGSFLRKDEIQASSPTSSMNSEEDCNNPSIEVTNNVKPIEVDSMHQESSFLATSFCLNTTTPFKKGILKRTPRGCRGLCTCLNCSSFRLHAEKAFEFSRNQMQDAEEVASDLIKELSHIRNMLEKFPFSADGHATVCASQVKEVCRRASEAEELAQNRLSEMNFDLNIHCRLTCTQRPRVRFANYVEEKVITKSDMPSKYCLIRRDKEGK